MLRDKHGDAIPTRDMPHEMAPDAVDTMTPDELQAWLDDTYGPVEKEG